MKHTIITILAVTLTTGGMAQDLKTNTIVTDLAALAFGGIAGEYRRVPTSS
ncbi:MAG: hypothetical protein QGF36_00430 [Candidatus Marinimicrobia bacterium]|jgi:hypothetical protein|nr:hypothetical protein [Candidatus Neomarinimicrobiota bacterium]MDP6935873.1 hypothetical protein [Candidatus Neomarinimicrobiota bacterium]